jgi:AcrR family transcriptional regulator
MPSSSPRLRRDAQRNRETLLAAAQAHFAATGIDAPLDQIARDAGLAIGTLYRHFPTRLDLIQALFAEKLQSWLAAAERADALADAWQGFVLFIEAMCQLQADDQGFNDLVSMRLPEAAGLAATQDRIGDIATRIIRRAQEQGSLRPDLTTEDLAFVIWSQSRINQATRDVAPRAWRRHLYLMVDGFRAERAHPLPEPPMTREQAYRAMIGLNGTCTRSDAEGLSGPVRHDPR